MPSSHRFDQALAYAALAHEGQLRKGTAIPFIAHLLAVAGIALESGATEDEAIGALLHDAGEDAGGQERIDDIRARFGDRVADIVQGCTDTVESPKPPWRQRKDAYIAHIAHASASVRLVVASDKLHNVRSIRRDYRTLGESLWSRFNAPRDDTLWFYRAVTDALRKFGDTELLGELDRAVSDLEHGVATRPREG